MNHLHDVIYRPPFPGSGTPTHPPSSTVHGELQRLLEYSIVLEFGGSAHLSVL